MKDLFLLIKNNLLKNEPLVLVTVIASSGSTPRGVGARMLVGKGPNQMPIRLWGSIGGGQSEHLAIEEAGALLRCNGTGVPGVSFKKYLLRPDGAAESGARSGAVSGASRIAVSDAVSDSYCGGEISVFFRVLDAREPGLPELIEEAIACFSKDKAAWFIMEVSADSFLGIAENPGPLLRNGPVYIEEKGKQWLSEPLVSSGFVYVFGGGHIAQELVPLLARLDFRCMIFDDREEFLTPDLFSRAEKLILGDFAHIEKYVSLTERDYAVILTRGHHYDLEAWAFSLRSPAMYIGVIGSKTKHGFVKTQLRERGFDDALINAPRVHAPIGMNIRSKTPAEIAVSIAGELILTRASITNP